MDAEVGKTSTTPPNPTRKNPWILLLVFGLALLIFILPLYGLDQYADILVSTPPAPSHPKADCAVVLTGGAGRVREGITLLSHRSVNKVIISGVHRYATLQEMMPEVVFYPEIKLDDVILERRSATTAGNAQLSLPIVEALHCASILLVTHDYHMHRALKTFLQAFPAAVRIIPYPIVSGRLHRGAALSFDPRFWSAVFDEWYKYLFYSVTVF
jgi:uncharacterized SAM-binding protein YcdF (DUF218 family)